MAKSETKNVAADETVSSFDPAALLEISLEDIDEKEPILADGRWAVQLMGYKVVDKGKGPVATMYLDPVEPVAVEYPGESYELIRQFHRLRLTETKDIRAAKRFLTAFGVTSGRLMEVVDGSVVYPAFEAACGAIAHVTAKEQFSKFFNRMETQLSGFTAAVEA